MLLAREDKTACKECKEFKVLLVPEDKTVCKVCRELTGHRAHEEQMACRVCKASTGRGGLRGLRGLRRRLVQRQHLELRRRLPRPDPLLPVVVPRPEPHGLRVGLQHLQRCRDHLEPLG